jgi:hypothetical protein
MAAAGQDPYTILGQGTYGAVFSPAFPNVNDDGNPVEFPGYVTKAFFTEDAFEKALKNAPMLAKNIPELHIPYSPYTRKTVYKNLPAAVRRNMDIRRNNTDPMYLIRMPDKGYSFLDIAEKKPSYKQQFARLPLETRLHEVYKLMNVVKAIGDAGYVHADIREPNILANLATGTMTLIDFDHFGPKNVFVNNYLTPYYHFPPEACIVAYPHNFILKCILQNTMTPEEYVNQALFHNSHKYHAKPTEYILYDFRQAAYDFAKGVKTNIESLIHGKGYVSTNEIIRDLGVQAYIERLEKKTADTADSFALAFCIRYLAERLDITYDRGVLGMQESESFNKLAHTNFIRNMMHGNASKRIGIEEGMEGLRAYAKRFGINLPAPTVRAAAKVAEAEAERMVALAGAAPSAPPTQLSDAEIHKGIKVRLDAMDKAVGNQARSVAALDLINFLRFNAVQFIEKQPGFRKVIIAKCHQFPNEKGASEELKEACDALLALIDPRPVSATRKSKSASAKAGAAVPVVAPSSVRSKPRSVPVKVVEQIAAAAEAVEEMPDPAAGAAKKPTRAEKKKLYWKTQRERRRTKKGAAGANA